MSLRIQVLTTTHDAALLELATACDTGSDAFRVDRSPEFFALSRALGDSTYYGAFRGDRLVGCFGVTLQKRFLGGDVRDFHYLHDVRVHPEHRGSGIYRCLLGCVFEDAGRRAGWAFATILDSNSRTDLLRGCGLLPTLDPSAAQSTSAHPSSGTCRAMHTGL